MHFVERRLGLSSLVLLLVVLSGCASTFHRPTIAVIPRQASGDFWANELSGATDAAARENLHIYWNGPSTENDVESQIRLTEKAIHAHSYGLLLSANNPFALNTLIERTVSRGIPVVVVGADVSITPRPGLSFVLNDETRTGELIAGRLRSILGNKGKVIILGVDPLSPGSVPRAEAVEHAIMRECPEIKIADELAGPFSFGRAELVIEQIIRKIPDVDAIISLGRNETLGAVAAVANLHATKRIRILGCDQDMDVLFLLRQSVIDSLVVQDSRSLGRVAVENVIAEHRGQHVAERVYLEPHLVTRENVDSPEIQAIVSRQWKPGT